MAENLENKKRGIRINILLNSSLYIINKLFNFNILSTSTNNYDPVLECKINIYDKFRIIKNNKFISNGNKIQEIIKFHEYLKTTEGYLYTAYNELEVKNSGLPIHDWKYFK